MSSSGESFPYYKVRGGEWRVAAVRVRSAPVKSRGREPTWLLLILFSPKPALLQAAGQEVRAEALWPRRVGPVAAAAVWALWPRRVGPVASVESGFLFVCKAEAVMFFF